MMDLDTFLDATRATFFPGTLPTLRLPKKAIFHQDSCVFCDASLVFSYHSCKEKTIKLLPYHSFYRGHITPSPQKKRKKNVEHPFPGIPPQKKNTNPPGSTFSSIPLQISNFICHEVCNISH